MMFDPQETVKATLTFTEGADVLAYVSQCECCGQRAITLAQHGSDWVCPRCQEVTDGHPYTHIETGHDCGLGANAEAAAAMYPQCQGRAAGHEGIPIQYRTVPFPDTDDDGPDLRKIQG